MSFGSKWVNVVHDGSKPCNVPMKFNLLFRVLDKYMSGGNDIIYFFRELMEMITDVSEVDWDTKKDPATKLTQESTIRNFTKRGLSKKLAKSIVHNLTPETLEERINERPKITLHLMAQDLQRLYPHINSENVGKIVSEGMVDYIYAAAGLVETSEMKKQRLADQAISLKRKYGDYLVEEEGGCCPFHNCGRKLRYSTNGKTIDCYDVSVIDNSLEIDLNTIIAFCSKHYVTYQLDHSQNIVRQIKRNKKYLSIHEAYVESIDDVSLEQGISEVITKISALKSDELVQISMDFNKVQNKLDPKRDFTLYRIVYDYVNTYFLTIKSIFENLDSSGKISYEGVQDNMRTLYRKQKDSRKTKMEIFSNITARVEKACLCEPIYCQIFVSYFIQSCEVFDAISQ